MSERGCLLQIQWTLATDPDGSECPASFLGGSRFGLESYWSVGNIIHFRSLDKVLLEPHTHLASSPLHPHLFDACFISLPRVVTVLSRMRARVTECTWTTWRLKPESRRLAALVVFAFMSHVKQVIWQWERRGGVWLDMDERASIFCCRRASRPMKKKRRTPWCAGTAWQRNRGCVRGFRKHGLGGRR